MTPRKEKSLRTKIKRIKDYLQEERKLFGAIHDGRGLRYEPARLYLQIPDYTGALRYFNWFQKHCPDDIGDLYLHFEWGLTYFKTKRKKLAEPKLLYYHIQVPYGIPHFLGVEPPDLPQDYHYARLKEVVPAHFMYRPDDPELGDFAAWLDKQWHSEKFTRYRKEFEQLSQALENEQDNEKRRHLRSRKYSLVEAYAAEG